MSKNFNQMTHAECQAWGEKELDLRIHDRSVFGLEAAKTHAYARRSAIGMSAKMAAHFVDQARRDRFIRSFNDKYDVLENLCGTCDGRGCPTCKESL